MTQARIYYTTPGVNVFTDSELSFVKVLKIKRQGLGFDKIETGTPIGRKALHTASSGSIEFENEFVLHTDGIRGEPIYVLFND
jgi:hypothetical protein